MPWSRGEWREGGHAMVVIKTTSKEAGVAPPLTKSAFLSTPLWTSFSQRQSQRVDFFHEGDCIIGRGMSDVDTRTWLQEKWYFFSLAHLCASRRIRTCLLKGNTNKQPKIYQHQHLGNFRGNQQICSGHTLISICKQNPLPIKSTTI